MSFETWLAEHHRIKPNERRAIGFRNCWHESRAELYLESERPSLEGGQPKWQFFKSLADKVEDGEVSIESLCAEGGQGKEAPFKYFASPLEFREPKTDNEGPCIYDANGRQIAMLFWPVHPVEETEAAEQETYRLGRKLVAEASVAQPPAKRMMQSYNTVPHEECPDCRGNCSPVEGVPAPQPSPTKEPR